MCSKNAGQGTLTHLESVLRRGLGVRQLARLTGVSYGIIQRVNEKVGQRTVP